MFAKGTDITGLSLSRVPRAGNRFCARSARSSANLLTTSRFGELSSLTSVVRHMDLPRRTPKISGQMKTGYLPRINTNWHEWEGNETRNRHRYLFLFYPFIIKVIYAFYVFTLWWFNGLRHCSLDFIRGNSCSVVASFFNLRRIDSCQVCRFVVYALQEMVAAWRRTA